MGDAGGLALAVGAHQVQFEVGESVFVGGIDEVFAGGVEVGRP